MSRPDRRTYEFGPFRLDPLEAQLFRNGEALTLTPKAFEALVFLVEHQGRLIEKEELMKALWPDTFVEEANLSHHVWRLRKALDDGKDGDEYIETVPKRGYRFIAPVKSIDASTTDLVVEEHTVTRLVAERETEEKGESVSFSAIAIERGNRFGVSTGTIMLAGLLVLVITAMFGYIKFRVKGATGSESTGTIKTLAVLPFKPLTPDNNDAALELGMADALITRLSNVKELTVRPTSAVIKFSSATDDLARVGQELNVQSILDGRVQRAGDRMRITVQLIRTNDGKVFWAEQFDEKFTDIFAFEDSLSERVARALSLRLSGSEATRIQQRYTDNIEAYQSYLRGRYQMNLASEGVLKAVGSFEDAIQKDPKFALAYAGAADAYAATAFMGVGFPPREQLAKAKAAASKALELDGSLAEAHVSLGNILFNYDWKFADAEKEFKRAIELNPNLAEAHHWYSEYLQAMTRWDEALTEIKRALELDPLSLPINFHYGLCLFGMGRDEEALAQYRKTLNFDSSTGASGSNWGIAQIYEKRGMYNEAIRELEEAKFFDPKPSFRAPGIAEAYALAGRRKEALELLAQLLETRKHEYISRFAIGQIYAALGDKDQAFAWFNEAIDEREMIVVYLRGMQSAAPAMATLRDDPRFQLLLQRVGLASK